MNNEEIQVGDMVALEDEVLERCYYGVAVRDLGHERIMVAWCYPDNKFTSMPKTVLKVIER